MYVCTSKSDYGEEDGDSVDSDFEFPAYCVTRSSKQSEHQSNSDDCVVIDKPLTHSKVGLTFTSVNCATTSHRSYIYLLNLILGGRGNGGGSSSNKQ